jgi:hypothetical protein
VRSFAILLLLTAAPAAAQAPSTRNQAVTSGPAGVQSRLQSQGYSGIHDLRRLPDGQWTGKATQNGVTRNITVAPDGTTISR